MKTTKFPKTKALTKKARAAKELLMLKLSFPERKTKKPVIIALIGLVGSGKSMVARSLAKRIGATVLSGDDIRVELRNQGEDYKQAFAIAENVAAEILLQGGNVILDSDFIGTKKRKSLLMAAKKAGIRVEFICTYADIDVMIGRMIESKPSAFFAGAESKWKGKNRGAVVKLREMIRRQPHHYWWEDVRGGRWVIKYPPCKVLADIDTSDPKAWPSEVGKCARKLLKK